MNCTTIASRAGRSIDESVDEQGFIVDTLNEFQEDIAEKLFPVGTVTINAVANTWYDLPDGLIKLYIDEDGSYGITKDGVTVPLFEFRERYPKCQIKFRETGAYEVVYERTPTELTALTDSPDMHPYLHSLGVLFLASRYKSMDDDENADAQRLMQEYEVKKRQRIAKLKNPSGDSGRVVVV
jgi:hypothetical protein